MADPLTLVPRLVPGVAVQVIDDDVLVLAGEDLTRLTGALARTIREIDGVPQRPVRGGRRPRVPRHRSSSSTPGRSRATAVPTTSE